MDFIGGIRKTVLKKYAVALRTSSGAFFIVILNQRWCFYCFYCQRWNPETHEESLVCATLTSSDKWGRSGIHDRSKDHFVALSCTTAQEASFQLLLRYMSNPIDIISLFFIFKLWTKDGKVILGHLKSTMCTSSLTQDTSVNYKSQ
jgi:hypothetical protein